MQLRLTQLHQAFIEASPAETNENIRFLCVADAIENISNWQSIVIEIPDTRSLRNPLIQLLK